jgi:hypothetical protein
MILLGIFLSLPASGLQATKDYSNCAFLGKHIWQLSASLIWAA